MPSLEFLQYTYLGNTVQHYLIAVGIFVLFLIGAAILHLVIKNVFKKLAKKTKTKLDDTIVSIVNKVVVFIIILAGVYFGLRALAIPENIWTLIEKGVQVIFIIKSDLVIK